MTRPLRFFVKSHKRVMPLMDYLSKIGKVQYYTTFKKRLSVHYKDVDAQEIIVPAASPFLDPTYKKHTKYCIVHCELGEEGEPKFSVEYGVTAEANNEILRVNLEKKTYSLDRGETWTPCKRTYCKTAVPGDDDS